MRKRIAGGVLMAVAAAAAFQAPQLLAGNTEQDAAKKPAEVSTVVAGIVADQVPIYYWKRLMETRLKQR